VSQDRTKGVVTLAGNVQSDDQRARAEAVAKANAAGQVVADEIAVLPPGANDPRTVNSDLDAAIAKNLDAALVQNRLTHQVSQDVKNGVVTLKGTVNSEVARDRVAKMAQRIPNVRQVVNELQIKDQKASSSSGY
jgi:hyperosmotically inducible protein